MDRWDQLIVIFVCIITFVCIYYMYFVKKQANINRLFDESVKKSEFEPTIFKIYDKSSETVCNRLIVVDPFHWYIWACRGELYILNPEGGIRCQRDSTPAIRVYATQFVETCLRLNMNSILKSYMTNNLPKIVPYEIDGKTFTIFSALNILMKDYITFDKEVDQTTPIQTASSRELSSENIVKITTRSSKNIHILHDQYLRHAGEYMTRSRRCADTMPKLMN